MTDIADIKKRPRANSDAEEKLRLLEVALQQNVDGHKGAEEAHVAPEETKEQPAIKDHGEK